MDESRVYTHVSGKALKGMQRLFVDRDIYISTNVSSDGYTVVTKPKKDVRKGGALRFGRRSRAAA